MTRLILTNDISAAGSLKMADLADIVIPIERRLVLGPPPSDAESVGFFAARSKQEHGLHWQDYTPPWRLEKFGGRDLGLIECCANCESVELWMDAAPNAQLLLIWLLDHFRFYGNVALRPTLLQADLLIGGKAPGDIAKSRPSAVKVANDHLETASLAWQAHRAPTPQAWFSLLDKDLGILPQLRQSVLELLEELPMRATGLGATEMWMLELISDGNARPFDVFQGHRKPNQRRVFDYWEVGSLLDALAHGPAPAVSGLNEGPFTLEMHDDRKRFERYKRSKLKLTALGKAILAQTEDFSRHNPIHRWWGGTELANDRLWRWDPANRTLIAP